MEALVMVVREVELQDREVVLSTPVAGEEVRLEVLLVAPEVPASSSLDIQL
jgi:hypothetical protein